MMIKSGNSNVDVSFVGVDKYTNKLSARNIEQNGTEVIFDYSHYRGARLSKGDPESTDAKKLIESIADIKRIIIKDQTVLKKLNWSKIPSVKLKVDGATHSFNVDDVNKDEGWINLK